MHDRFVRGYTAGVVGGIAMTILSLLLFSLGLASSRNFDIPAMIYLGYVPNTIGEQFIAEVIHLGHAALMGISFAYIFPWIGRDYFVFKGATFGAFTWSIVFGIGSLFKVPLFYNLSWITVTSYLFTSAIWGAVMSLALVWLEEHGPNTDKSYQPSKIIADPAFKHWHEDNADRLEELIKRHDELLIKVTRKKLARKRSFLSRFKFW